MIKGKKLYCSEHTQGQNAWLLIENEEAEDDLAGAVEFKLDGYVL